MGKRLKYKELVKDVDLGLRQKELPMAMPRKTRKRMTKRAPPSSARAGLAPNHAKAGVEFNFWIDVYTPATIPMARLAEYMAQLASMLGEPSSVHFVRLMRGSTGIVHRVQAEAVPKVRERASAIRRGDAPRDALRAYDAVNKMLREDNGVGALKEETAVIIPFPGIETAEEKFSGIKERGTIDGEIIRVGGPHKWVPILVES